MPSPPVAERTGRGRGSAVGSGRAPAGRARPERRSPWPARVAAGYLLLLCLLLLLTRVVAEGLWWTTLLLYFPQVVYAAPALVLLPWAVHRRDGRALLATLLAVGVVLWPLMGFNVPRPRERDPRAVGTVRLLAYNIHGATLGIEEVAANVRRFRPDVVVFSEATGWGREEELRDELDGLFPGWSSVRGGDIYIASRWPLQERRAAPLLPINEAGSHLEQRQKVRVAVAAPFGPFHVCGTHFRTAIYGETLLKNRRGVPDYMAKTGGIRLKQAQDVLASLRPLEGPVVLAGDFNTPPAGLIYDRLTRRYRDAFAEAGWGWGYTYPARLPLLRIDYVFHSPHWRTRTAEVGSREGSDHRPLFAELELLP